MKYILFVVFLLWFTLFYAQESSVVISGEYIDAQNYGGKKELKRFFQNEMNYPAEALKNKEEGIVEIASIIDHETGFPNSIHVKTSVSKSLDQEAIRLYKLIQFKPFPYKGKNVITYSTLKFKFSLKNFKRNCKKRKYDDALEAYDGVLDTFTVFKDNQVKIKPKILFENKLDNIATFIQKNMRYPEGTRNLNITGTAKLHFVVEPSGRITNVKVLRSVGGGGTEEAIRLLMLTRWRAGEKEGGKVRVSKVFEVGFHLSNEPGMEVAPNSY